MKKTLLILLFFFLCNLTFAQEKWLINNPDGFDFYLTTEIKNGEIIGKTRDNALKDIVGWLKFNLAKMATSVKYPEIVHFKGNVTNNSFKGNYQMIFSQKNFSGIIKNNSLFITLTNKDKTKTELIGTKIDKIKPIRDYKKTFNEIFEITENNIYNQKFIKSKQWEKFKKKMLKISDKINDDLELQIAFSAITREFPFSHYYLYQKKSKNKSIEINNDFAELKEMNKNTVLLKIKSFSGSKQQMDSLISIIDNKNYQNLIIDLRNNPGGNHVSAYPLAEYIIDKPIIAGVFPNKNWYSEYNRLPNKNDYSKFSEFTGGTLNEWFDKGKKSFGSYFKVLPSEKHFKGKVYILTNKQTGSTCEPIVYGLKHNKYATIIGEHTAGAMLSSNEFIINNEIIIRIPLNDYITYSGERIDRIGVEPDIKVKSENALKYTMELITVGNKVYK